MAQCDPVLHMSVYSLVCAYRVYSRNYISWWTLTAVMREGVEQMEEEKVCGTCRYYKYETASQGYVCCNCESDYLADWTDYSDFCNEWEGKDE